MQDESGGQAGADDHEEEDVEEVHDNSDGS